MASKEDPDNFHIIDPFDMNGPDFNPDLYLSRLLKEKSLTHLMDKESTLYRQIQSLDSDMQTLVYENFNKFISATETIRKMSSNFDKMEQELESLSENVSQIISNSKSIQTNLSGKRSKLEKLSSTHTLLQKLHFMFELTPKMNQFIRNKDYNEAVKYYLKAETALEQYRRFPSIFAIDTECRDLLTDLKDKLHAQFNEPDITHSKVSETVHLLLNLREDSLTLATKYLECCDRRLDTNRSELDYYIKESEKLSFGQSTEDVPMDVLEFVDMACNGYLSNLCTIIASYQSLFLSQSSTSGTSCSSSETDQRSEETDLLSQFVDKSIHDFFDRIRLRFSHERPFSSNSYDVKFLSRSLDRFYSRLQSLKKVYTLKDYSKHGRSLIIDVVKSQSNHSFEFLKTSFNDQLIEIRQTIAMTGLVGGEGGQSSVTNTPPRTLSEMVSSIELNITDNITLVVSHLVTLRSPSEVFFSRDVVRDEFDFAKSIREDVVVSFIEFVINSCNDFRKIGSNWSSPTQLILILSRLCFDLDSNNLIAKILTNVDETLSMKPKPLTGSISHRSGSVSSTSSFAITTTNELTTKSKETAQNLINHYVRREGSNISNMIRKSFETRDWLSTIEPRSVRSVMKRVIEDITTIDSIVSELYEEGSKVERSSDHSSRSRRTFSAILRATGGGHGNKMVNTSAAWSTGHSSSMIDQNLMSNIQKLFSEKIEIFTPIDFSKLSIVTGIVKIVLKSILECVRSSTFSKFGLQQIQVDSFYLQMFLWKFVTDENIVHNLLDEILNSTITRTIEQPPTLMEVSVVEKICEGL